MAWDPWKRPTEATLEFDGAPRRLQVARLSVAQKTEFAAGLSRLMGGMRGALPDDATDDERDAWDARWRREIRRQGEWLNEAVSSFLRPLEPWTSADGVVVATGTDLAEAYQTDQQLSACVLLIWMQNELPADLRKNLPSPLALLRSWGGSASGTNGGRQEPTADAAAPPASVSNAAATDALASASSGTTTATSPSP